LTVLAGCSLQESLNAHHCEIDEHCSLGRICVNGECQDAPPPADGAATDAPAEVVPDAAAATDGRDGGAELADGRAPDVAADGANGCGADEFRGATRCVSKVVAVAAASKRTCAVLQDGTVWCWGGMSNVADPLQVPNVNDARSIVLGGSWGPAGGGGACVVTASQRVRCWGDDSLGQLGDGDSPPFGEFPSTVVTSDGQPLTGVVSLAMGKSFACASTLTTIHCWGENTQGQLAAMVGAHDGQKEMPGPPRVYYRTFAAPTGLAPGVVAAGENAGMTVDATGRVCGWGWSAPGFWPHTPTPATPECLVMTGAKQVVMGWGGACWRTGVGEAWCWAYDLDVFEPPGGVVNTGVAVLAAGREHVCALHEDGHVSCWGKGNQGELGNEPKPLQFTVAFPAEEVKALGTDAVAIGSGQSAMHTCAIMKDGSLRCWGRNAEGQLGNAAEGPTPGKPVVVQW
jgi:hypothetical protein